ncbi:carbohydrate ABC transporter substrate-binding protein (CUT1 family) [Kitasatospora sp. SolWspMP-SS2h]|uniref:extracellular solute-binding protein n=1 Tax=Kitasatospora sp. SolWspMP-SS2h TaxID=1305729 RepID=UPI000DB9289B|nr:extracellular solute-binding protein [Kitasatospora sp. SolWspMP-SS2h]RAJ36814.1 carbohydrate ABC transporter substrate-binding protein (CUT1 family) [Kitasatospora sp. SolWspMP-SS2h]
MRQPITSPLTSRRTLLTGALGIGAGLTLAACGSGSSGGSSHTPGGAFRTPAAGPVPSPMAGEHRDPIHGVPAAYDRYPSAAEQFTSVAKAPGSGGTMTALMQLATTPAPGRGDNRWWQELEKRLNLTWQPTLVGGSDIGDRAQTIIASGDMPDLFNVNHYFSPAIDRSVKQGAFAELSDHLGGSAILEYPNLARLPDWAWRNSSIDGAIYGVPRPTPLVNNVAFHRQDWRKKLGMDVPRNADDVFALLTAFTKSSPAGDGVKTWGLSDLNSGFFAAMHRVPSTWRLNQDGTLTKDHETDEWEAMLVYMRKLWVGGAFHPDAPTMPWDQQRQLFLNGSIGMHAEGFNGMVSVGGDLGVIQRNSPGADLQPMLPPGFDGGKPLVAQDTGYWGYYSIPAKLRGNKDKIREVLRVCDYFAAPFGSSEYTFVNYGIADHHFTYGQDGAPVPTTNAARLSELSMAYMCQPSELNFFFPGQPAQVAQDAQTFLHDAMPVSAPNPVVNLYSETAISKTPVLKQLIDDLMVAVVTGRKPISALAEARQSWKSQGGDQMRAEYEKALAKKN